MRSQHHTSNPTYLFDLSELFIPCISRAICVNVQHTTDVKQYDGGIAGGISMRTLRAGATAHRTLLRAKRYLRNGTTFTYRNGHSDHIVGVQCKLKSGRSKLTKAEALKEIKQALLYQPLLSDYFIVSTSKDDVKLLQLAQEQAQK